MSINRVMICGRLTREPEMRSTAGGLAVMGLGVAVNDRRKNQQTGEWEDVPNYVDCTMFGPYAQAMERRLSKGAKVAIDGRLRWSQWERDGQRRSKLEVVVEGIEIMGGGSDAEAPPAAAAARARADRARARALGVGVRRRDTVLGG